jgi:hypothetical protein
MVLIINYALRNQYKDYAPFFNAVKQNCDQWWHFLDSTWIIVTNHSAHEYAQFLLPHIEATDSLFVARLHKDYQGWLPAEAWDWLNSKFF